MPMNKTLYPKNWAEISAHIRERAKNCCEQCGVPNGIYIVRSTVDAERYLVFDEETAGVRYPNGERIKASEEPGEYAANEKLTRVVLTVAHLDHNPQNNADDNLRCLCQLHHLRHDAVHHARNAARTRREKHDKETGQLALFEAGGQVDHG